jgi:Tol biopolymer transport system component
MRTRFLLPATVASLFVAATACSGGSPPSACRSAPEPRFLLASQDGLSEMRPDGSRRTIVQWDDETYPLDPALSPDCKKIAVVIQPPARTLPDGNLDFGSDIVVVGSDGKGERLLGRHQRLAEFLRTPAWISNTEILYTYLGRRDNGETDMRIERLDVSSGTSSRFLDAAIDPAVSPDLGRVAFNFIDARTGAETLTVARLDLSERRPIVDAARAGLGLFSAQVFSPDGMRIAFAAVDLSSPAQGGLPPPRASAVLAAHPFAQDIWLVNVDGSGLRRVAEVAENMPSIAWSGDGAFLYVLGPAAFWRIDVASGNAEKIAPGVPQGQIVRLAGP